MPVDTTFYDILGVAVNATTEQIAKVRNSRCFFLMLSYKEHRHTDKRQEIVILTMAVMLRRYE